MGEAILTNGVSAGMGSGGAEGLPPTNCKHMKVERAGVNYKLTFEDPADTIIDGFVLCTWSGTKIVRKAGEYPQSPDDGVLVLDNKERGAYTDVPFIDVAPDSENEYFYSAYPYTVNGVTNLDPRNKFGAVVFGFYIDSNDSNSATRVHYMEDNESFKPAKMNYITGEFDYGDWKNAFFHPRPVMVKNDGKVDYELNPADYTLKKDGTASDVTNTAYLGNAMVGFPQVWLKYENIGSRQYVYISNRQVNPDFKCYTHYNQNGELLNEIFMPIYEGSYISNKIRSLSSQAIGQGQTSATERTYATANGAGWFTGVLSDYLLVCVLLTLIGRSTDTQTVFGNGRYTGGTSAASLLQSGLLNKNGQFYGTTGNDSVKTFGMENFYGNRWNRIAGWVNNKGEQKIKLTHGKQDGSTVEGYNEDGTGYISLGLLPSGTSGGYISKSALTPYGLFPQVASGSSSTYACDGFWFNNGQNNYALVGDSCFDGLLAGAFGTNLHLVPSAAAWSVGASLSCKPL